MNVWLYCRRPRASCLFDSTPPTERRDKWPGQMMDADSQCRYVHGPRTGLCGVSMRTTSLMTCTISLVT